MPIITFDSKESIPEGLGEAAKQNGEKWEVNVVLKSKLDEFRENNIALSEERDNLKATNESLSKIIGEDSEAFVNELTDLRKTAQQVADGKLKASNDIEAEVENRVKAMREGYESQIAELTTKNKAANEAVAEGQRKYNNTVVDRYITDAVLNPESGVNPAALPDILARARGIFKVAEEGKVVAMKSDNVVLYGADGATPMTGEEWVAALKKDAPHFFKSNTGGGAGGSDKKYPNGMSKEDFEKLPASQRLRYANEGKI